MGSATSIPLFLDEGKFPVFNHTAFSLFLVLLFSSISWPNLILSGPSHCCFKQCPLVIFAKKKSSYSMTMIMNNIHLKKKKYIF